MVQKQIFFVLGFLTVGLSLALPVKTYSQVKDEDALYLRKIYDAALTQGRGYDWLEYLCERIGHRLSGTPQAAAAVEYTRQMLDTMGLDRVWLQPCTVPHWERGEPEQARIVNSRKMGTVDLHVVALGNSEGTGPMGITAEVVEVFSLDEVDKLGSAVAGKIVFYNRPLDPPPNQHLQRVRGCSRPTCGGGDTSFQVWSGRGFSTFNDYKARRCAPLGLYVLRRGGK